MSPDPITIEILRNAFVMAAEEMNAALIRSAYTPVIYESKDCAVAFIDSRHRVLGQSSGVPLFLGNLEAGTHMHDVTVFAPSSTKGTWPGSPPPGPTGWT